MGVAHMTHCRGCLCKVTKEASTAAAPLRSAIVRVSAAVERGWRRRQGRLGRIRLSACRRDAAYLWRHRGAPSMMCPWEERPQEGGSPRCLFHGRCAAASVGAICTGFTGAVFMVATPCK